MPWQSVPPLVIITLAFGAAGGLLQLNNYMWTGRREKRLGVDPFDIRLKERDVLVNWRRERLEHYKANKQEIDNKMTPGMIKRALRESPTLADTGDDSEEYPEETEDYPEETEDRPEEASRYPELARYIAF